MFEEKERGNIVWELWPQVLSDDAADFRSLFEERGNIVWELWPQVLSDDDEEDKVEVLRSRSLAGGHKKSTANEDPKQWALRWGCDEFVPSAARSCLHSVGFDKVSRSLRGLDASL